MNFTEYQEFTRSVNLKPTIEHLKAATPEELGELYGHLKRLERDGKELDRAAVAKELGDLLWCVSEFCSVLNYDLQYIAETNVAKLKDRLARNVIKGSGDDR